MSEHELTLEQAPFQAWHKKLKFNFILSQIDWDKKLVWSYPMKVKDTHTWGLLYGVSCISHMDGTVSLGWCPFEEVDISQRSEQLPKETPLAKDINKVLKNNEEGLLKLAKIIGEMTDEDVERIFKKPEQEQKECKCDYPFKQFNGRCRTCGDFIEKPEQRKEVPELPEIDKERLEFVSKALKDWFLQTISHEQMAAILVDPYYLKRQR